MAIRQLCHSRVLEMYVYFIIFITPPSNDNSSGIYTSAHSIRLYIIIPNGTHYSANWCKNRVTYHLARVSIMVYFYIKY